MQNPFTEYVQEIAQHVDMLIASAINAHDAMKDNYIRPAWEHAAAFEYNVRIDDVEMAAYLDSMSEVNPDFDARPLYQRSVLLRVDYTRPGMRVCFIATDDEVSKEIREYLDGKDKLGTVESMLRKAVIGVTGEMPF